MKQLLFLCLAIPTSVFADVNLSTDIWNIKIYHSEMDDSKNVTMFTQSLKPIEVYSKAQRANLKIVCRENQTDLYIVYGVYLHNDHIKVEYRLDDDKSVKATWDVSTDYKATFARKPVQLIKSMFDKERMLVRLTPYSGSPTTVEFNISGLKESVEPLRKACKW